MHPTLRSVLAGVLTCALAAPVLAAPDAPVLGSGGSGAPAPAAPAPVAVSAACGSNRFAPTFTATSGGATLAIRDTQEGWTWTSAPLFGKPVDHRSGGASCGATVVDLDGDGTPEVVVTLDDDPSGAVWIFRRVPGQPSFAPVPCESGNHAPTRNFLVWDVSVGPGAPVVIADGEIQVKGKLSLLGQGTTITTFHFRLQDGVMRYQQQQAASAFPH